MASGALHREHFHVIQVALGGAAYFLVITRTIRIFGCNGRDFRGCRFKSARGEAMTCLPNFGFPLHESPHSCTTAFRAAALSDGGFGIADVG